MLHLKFSSTSCDLRGLIELQGKNWTTKTRILLEGIYEHHNCATKLRTRNLK